MTMKGAFYKKEEKSYSLSSHGLETKEEEGFYLLSSDGSEMKIKNDLKSNFDAINTSDSKIVVKEINNKQIIFKYLDYESKSFKALVLDETNDMAF